MNSIGGMKIVISNDLPGSVIGTLVRPLWPHPFVRWLLRKMRRKVHPVMYIAAGGMVSYEEPVFYKLQDSIICNRAGYDLLKKEMKKNETQGSYSASQSNQIGLRQSGLFAQNVS